MSTPSTNKGTLTIAGSGIASIGQITLETLSYIEQADRIFYVTLEPATAAYIIDKSKDASQCFDLTVYYDKYKKRYESYVQMAEVMLVEVRRGFNVLGIFYGHPGVFVFPSHRAISIARDEGFQARMLAGVSAEDCLFSDVGFDPASGCMTQEASDLLMAGRTLDPSIHNVIWQVGAVGVQNMVFDNARFHLLVDRIEADFGTDYKLIHYIAAILPQSLTIMDELSIADLRKEEIIRGISATSTFYLPPINLAQTDPTMVDKLAVLETDSTLQRLHHFYPRSKYIRTDLPFPPAYGDFEKEAVRRLKEHVVPKEQIILRGSPALRHFMADLSLQPALRQRYKEDPAGVVNAIEGMTPEEKFGLTLNHVGPVLRLMQSTQAAIDEGEVLTLDELAGAVNDAQSIHANAAVACVFGLMVIVITI